MKLLEELTHKIFFDRNEEGMIFYPNPPLAYGYKVPADRSAALEVILERWLVGILGAFLSVLLLPWIWSLLICTVIMVTYEVHIHSYAKSRRLQTHVIENKAYEKARRIEDLVGMRVMIDLAAAAILFLAMLVVGLALGGRADWRVWGSILFFGVGTLIILRAIILVRAGKSQVTHSGDVESEEE